MLYIITKGQEYQWHVDTPPVNVNLHSVEEVQADCDELELILTKCKNIPYHNGRVQNWYGDHAKFIAKAVKAAEDPDTEC